MKIHIIVDFMHLYYRFFFTRRTGRLGNLSAPIEWNGTTIQKDTTLIYYPLSEIEKFRRNVENLGHEVTVSVCFDSKSHKAEDESTEYKANRTHLLTDEDHENIDYTMELLRKAGHNVYKVDGYEADDIVKYLVQNTKDKFDLTGIYTNDKDLFVNIDNNVVVNRYRKKGEVYNYAQINRSNYEDELESEFGVRIPYNALGLYLATVGDNSDNIKGIYRFGKTAFSKLITKVASANEIDWSKCGDYNELYKVVEKCKPFLTDEQYVELMDSFRLVANAEFPNNLAITYNISTKELREASYSHLNMVSLIP